MEKITGTVFKVQNSKSAIEFCNSLPANKQLFSRLIFFLLVMYIGGSSAIAQLNSTSSQTISTNQSYSGASQISNSSIVTVSAGTTTFTGSLIVGNTTAGTLLVKSGATVIVNGYILIGTGNSNAGAVVVENGGKLIVNPGATASWTSVAAISINSTAAKALDVQSGGSVIVNAGTGGIFGMYETSASNVDIAGALQIRGGGFKMDNTAKLTYSGSGNDTIIGPSNAGAYFSNNTKLTVGAGVNLYISGDVKNDSNAEFAINGNVSINGNYQSGNNTANVTGSGTLNTTGSLDADGYQGSVFGQRYSCTSGPCAGSNLISSSNTSTCSGGIVNITGAAITGATYQWLISTTSATTGFTSISGATAQDYSTTGSAATQYTYYKRQYALSGQTYNSNTLTITSSYWMLAPAVLPVSGSGSVCSGASITLSDATSGGVWSSAATGIATINASGVVTGVSGGTAVISYTVTSGGCSGAATKSISVVGTNTTTISSSGSYTVPAGAKAVLIQAWGAGGSGSKGYSGLKGTGGGGGGFAQKTMNVSGGNVLSVTIGTGASGATVSGNGSAGGTTSVTFGSVVASATGGAGGVSTATPSGTGGAGGIFSIGDFGYSGGSGATIQQPSDPTPGGGAGSSAGTASNGNNAGNTSPGSGSNGGTAVTGGAAGGSGGTSNANGDAGGFPGGGGGGNAGTGNGGNGGNGRVIITTYYTSITYSGTPFCKSVTSAVPAIDGVTGGTFSSTTGLTINTTTGEINPSTSTVGNYTVSYSNSCGVISTTFVKILATPTASAGGAQTICQSGTAMVSGAASSNGTIAWTENGAGSITSGAATLTPVYTSAAADGGTTVTLTMTVSNGLCANATATYSVVVSTCARTWTGATNADWSTNTNWSPATAPVPTDDVVIPSSVASNRMPTISASTDAKSVTNNGTITMTAAGALNVYGNLVNNGTFTTVSGSKVSFTGSSAQTMNGISTLYDLVINNTGSGVSLSSAVTVKGTLSLKKGVLTTNSKLTINFDNGGNIAYNASDAGSISGTVNGRRDVIARTHYIAAPFSGVTSAQVQATTPLFVNPYWKMYTKDFATQGWAAVINTTTAMPLGTGFSLSLPAAAPLIFTGTYSHAFALTGESYSNTTVNKYFMVGNPYPSTIDWNNSSGWTKTNIGGAIYYWDPANNRTATYVSGTGTNGGTQYIAPMQSVLVATTGSGGSSSVSINNNARLSQNSSYFRVAQDDVVRITLISRADSMRNDETVIRFNELATDSFDYDLDAHKIMNTGIMPSVFTNSKADLYSVNSFTSVDSAQYIPVGTKLPLDGAYKLKITGNNPNIDYILVDKQLGIKRCIEADSVYAFNGLRTDDVNRFELQLRVSAVTVPTGIQSANKNGGLGIYSSTKGFVIKTDRYAGEKAEIEILDLTGNSINTLEGKNLSAGSTYIPLDMADGAYLIRVHVEGNTFAGMIVFTK